MMLRLIIISAIACICSEIPNANAASSAPCFIWSQSAKRRDDYTFIPGVGAHKFHKQPARGWNDARRICIEEGGHLAVINSIAEGQAIHNLMKIAASSGTNIDQVYIGFHDLFQQGDYVTVHDQSLAMAGFTEWADGQPDRAHEGTERCGSLYRDGKLNDLRCNQNRPFICELLVE